MRNALCLSACLFLLSACGSMDDYWSDDGYDDHHHGHNNVYNNGGTYYPYGNASYPRDRIYVIERQQPCHGYAYQGYCYRNKNDYQNSVAWDRDHGRDNNGHKQRKDWCNDHDCGNGHDSRDHNNADHQGSRHDQNRDQSQHGWSVPEQEQSKRYRRARTTVDQPSTEPDAGHQEKVRRHERPVVENPEPSGSDSQQVKRHSGQRSSQADGVSSESVSEQGASSPEQRPRHEGKSRRGSAKNQQSAPRSSEGAPAE
jgi:hypothetical protein